MKILAIAFTAAFSLAAFAGLHHKSEMSQSEISKIENPDIICSQDGAAVLINSVQERLWQTDAPDEEEGLELQVESFLRARCPNCYTIKGIIPVMGQSLPLRYEVKGNPSDLGKARLRVIGGAEGDTFEIANMECEING